MNSKIRVYGKAQNRTVLGIINAYLIMYPNATLSDLQKAFPDSLNPDAGVKKIFEKSENSKMANFNGYFNALEELLQLQDGTAVALATMWTKKSFDRIVAHAQQYGIEVAEFLEADKGIGKKGGYRIEYLNGYVPAAPKKSRKTPVWLWIILILLFLALLFFFFLKG